MEDKKIVIVTGATGTIGKALCQRLQEKYRFVVFSRDAENAHTIVPDALAYVPWNPLTDEPPIGELNRAFAIVHLSSAPAFGARWTPAYKELLYKSCVSGTRRLVDAMIQADSKPQVFICASSIGYYGYRSFGTDQVAPLDEDTSPGKDFIAHLNIDWEREAERAGEAGIRTVLLRTGFLLDKRGGGLPYIIGSTKRFMGGSVLPGTQYQPWIHIDDEVEMIMMALEDVRVKGPINAVAPEHTTNSQLMASLRKVLGRPFGLPTPGGMMQFFMGDAADILTRGRPVTPRKMLDLGYQFRYSTIESALKDLTRKES